MVELLLLATVTALATGVGALPVYWLGERAEALRPAMWGVVAGVMSVASVQGLLLPGLNETDDVGVLAGVVAGVAFLLVARAALGRNDDLHLGAIKGAGARRGLLVFAVLFAHSLPEGLALGSSWASHTAGLGLFVFLAIAIQNVPEGTAVAIPLREAGVSLPRSVWTAILTSAPQPAGAAFAYALVETTQSLLGPSFGFAAGAMLALVVIEVVPAILSSARPWSGLRAAAVSATLMAALGALLEVG